MKNDMEQDTELRENPSGGEAETADGAQAAEAAKDAETVKEAEQPEGAGEQETIEDPEKEALRKTAEEHYQRYLRTQADFDNFRRRTRQEKEEFAKYASQTLIEGLLPIMDNFDRAVAASRENQDFDVLAKGVDMIGRQLAQLLEAEGLKPIESVGQPFNPELHQAVMTVEAEEGTESGIVVEELQKGYMLKERVIRPSMVKVTQ